MHSIDIQPKPSRIAIFLSVSLGFGSIIAMLGLPQLPGLAMVLLLVICFIYALYIICTHAVFVGPWALKGLRHISGVHWQIKRNKREYIGVLTGDSTVTSLFCVLRFQTSGKPLKYSCVLFRDSFELDEYRQLLLRLRCFKSIKA